MTQARKIINEILPAYEPNRYNGYLFGFTENNYEVAKEDMVRITAELIHRGANPNKIRKLYTDIVQTPEGQNILNIFDAIHRFHDIATKYLEQSSREQKYTWTGGNA